MSDSLVILLPTVCDPADAATHWWRVSDGAIVERGSDQAWRALSNPSTGRPGLPLVALAPVGAVRLGWPVPEGATERQQLGVARASALQQVMSDPDTLHAVSGLAEGRLATAVVGNGSMIEWLDWLEAQGADPLAILPSGLLMPWSEQWVAAAVGPERMIGRAGLVAPDEPALREALVGEAEVSAVPAELLEGRLALLAGALSLNLRTGRFARRRLLLLDWHRLRELAALALLIPLIGLVMGLVMLVRLNQASASLEAETARLASAALGQQVTAAAAATALDTRIGETPGASGSPFPPLVALYQQLQQVPGTTASAVAFRPDGTLTASLAATRVDEINRLLLALQRSGYRVTATTRTGPGGQMIADLTLRGAE